MPRIADEQIDLGRPVETRIDHHMRFVIQADRREGQPHEIAHVMRAPGRDHEVVGSIVLQHQPHRANVIAGKTPITLRIEVAQPQLVRHTEFNSRNAVANFARDELFAPPRRFVVEQDTADGKQVVRLAVIYRDPMAVQLRHAVRRTRIIRRCLILRNRLDFTEHLRARCLIETNLRIDRANRFEHARYPQRRKFAGKYRLGKRRRNE